MTFLINPYRFAPSHVPDPSYPDAGAIVLQVEFDGADNATTATDDSASAHTLTFSGNAKILSNKLELDGTNDLILLADSDDWHWANGDFCVEFFGVEFDDTSGSRVLMSQGNAYSGSTERSWIFTHAAGVGLQYNFSVTGSDSNIDQMDYECTTGHVYYICFERIGGILRCYVGVDGADANVVYQAANTLNLSNSPTSPRIGTRRSSGAEIDDFDGRMAAIRIIKGGAPHDQEAPFTPPTLPLPAP